MNVRELLKQLGLQGQLTGASTGRWWSETHDLPCIDSINPTTESLIASVHVATAKDYQRVKAEAKQAQQTWRQVPAPVRGQLIQKMGQALRQHKDALGSLVSLEMGKSKAEGDGEVQEMIDMADFVVGQSRMLYGYTMHSERPKHRMYEQWHPRGIVGIFSAYNFPVAVWSWNAFLAAICGNVSIWKPSPKTPLCALAVQKICQQVMVEAGYNGIFNLFITADNTLAQNIVSDPDIDLLSFTGSSEVGLKIKQMRASLMREPLLELSGNNAIIVDESADIDMAVQATFFSAIGTAGQRCTSTRRLFLHESLYDKFMRKLQTAYAQVKIGDPLQTENHMGPLIDQQAVDNYKYAISAALEAGGQLLFGGKVLSKTGYFVEPVIIAAENHWPIVQTETFAPILYVMRFAELQEAINRQNQVMQGLSSALFSRDMRHVELFLSAIGSDCGIANVNQGTTGAEIGGAFGGEKWTGGGREAGSTSWQAYMRRQTVTINWSDELPLAQGIEFGYDE